MKRIVWVGTLAMRRLDPIRGGAGPEGTRGVEMMARVVVIDTKSNGAPEYTLERRDGQDGMGVDRWVPPSAHEVYAPSFVAALGASGPS
jgi:hypothetical protein